MPTEAVQEIARRAHAGQADRAGRDYFDAHLTPIAEAAAIFGPEAESAGWLHDILEDTGMTAEQLAAFGVPDGVIAAVEAVTRRTDESYEQLIERACAHPHGKYVKLVDNAWNLTSHPVLAALEPDAAAAMLQDKYLPARERLLAAAGLTMTDSSVLKMQAILDRHHARLTHTWFDSDKKGGPEVTAFRRRARIHQSNWRLKQGYPAGEHPPGVNNGSVMDATWSAANPGANFLSDPIRRAVDLRLSEENRQHGQTLDPHRLRWNLLSSMPLCFNLFGEAAHDPARLSAFGASRFGISSPGTEIRFEWSPDRLNPEFTGDRTAFDAALAFGPREAEYILGVETKYHEWAAPEERPDADKRLPRYREITEKSGIFRPDWEDRILGSPLQQIWRDHLLLLSLLQHPSGRWVGGKYVLVYPARNPSFARAADQYRDVLIDDATFDDLTLEDALDAGVLTSETEAKFRQRYLW